ncbi:MAG: protein-glutamate O-methyltransferase CheR [Desulfobacteraceae bacterium]|nr:protein-glutamate O-methyltransferase CheR [Desulfobacteraceae bacterium]
MNNELKRILSYLNEKHGLDFSGYRVSMVERRVGQRFPFAKCDNYNDYFLYLQDNPDELDNLIDVLTINVSRFFRNSLAFEYLADRILPVIYHQKKETLSHSLRVWSAGCSMGEEPYSTAILIHEYLKEEAVKLKVNIFATDIDGKTLEKAQKAVYPFESIKDVKYRFLKEYFSHSGNSFQLMPEIREMVSFSMYDILDNSSYVPPESIFGDFDMVLCRNVLIYFNTAYQDKIFDKLYRALTRYGYLVLGEAEIPPPKYERCFRRVNDCCHIYQKI